jgi:hypothetical protein
MTRRRGRPARAPRCNPRGMAPTIEVHLRWSYLKARLQEADSPSLDDALIANDGRRLRSKREVLEFLTELEPVVRSRQGCRGRRPAPSPHQTWRVSRHIFGPMTSGTSSWEGWPGSSMVALGRQTMSITWLMGTSKTLRRFAVALLDLNARVRVGGLDDAEASLLPVVHGQVLERTEISTWRTDAGKLDVLSNIPDRHGRKLG